MTRQQAEAAIRSMLRHLRRRAGRISQEEIRRYEAAIRGLADRFRAGREAQLTPAKATVLKRQVNTLLDQVDKTLQGVAEKAIRTISTEIKTRYQVVHARLFDVQGLDSGGIVQRFEVLPRRTLERLARLGGRNLSLDRIVTRNVDAARVAVERFVTAATGKVADDVAVNSILRLLDGKLPIDLKGLGLEEKDVTPAKGLLARGRRIVATESFNTMREGTAEGSTISPIVQVAHWNLSDRHADLPSSPDECDDIAEADVGFGPGWYLPESWPSAPHPHCGCFQGDIRAVDPSEWEAAA